MKGFNNTLYKRVDSVLCYHEAWAEQGVLFECWGRVGEPGQLRESKIPQSASAKHEVFLALERMRDQGYCAMGINGYARLLVEHNLGRPSTEVDVDERLILEYRIGDVLDETGLGGTSGGEVWPEAYEVFCFVADFQIAKRVIAADLHCTKYAHARIYEEDPSIFGTLPTNSKILGP